MALVYLYENCHNDDDLNFVLEYKIILLLEEYYYGDDEGLKSVKKTIEEKGAILKC